MNKLNFTILLVIASILTACAEPAPRLEAEFGNSTRATLNAQIINPNAGNNPDPVAGLDGRAARDAIQNYKNSFTNPEPTTNAFTIGIGSGGGTSK